MELSIIIPAYNVENYLRQCLDSVLNQRDANNYEILLVNDGSTDDTLTVCREYESKHNNIRLINKDNEGLAIARNEAVNKARGQYIIFLDADDWWPNSYMLKEIHKVICTNKPDLIAFGISATTEDGTSTKEINSIHEVSGVYDSGEGYIDKLLSIFPGYEWYPVCYAISRSIIQSNDIYFPEGKKYEDLMTTYKYIINSKNIVVLDSVYYMYRQSPGSITKIHLYKNIYDHLLAAEFALSDIKNLPIQMTVKQKLSNNIATAYYAVLIESFYLPKEERDKMIYELEKRRDIMNCTFTGKQVMCKKLIQVLGIKNVGRLLHIRSFLRQSILGH